MADAIPYMYQLQGQSYAKLAAANFKIAVVDPDDSQLSSAQLTSLESSGKTVMGYLSIGEAEPYRSYWQSSWSSNPPSFLLGEDSAWGTYYVKYWDASWQKLMIDKAVAMAKAGYDGMVMDVVDAYTVGSVAAAYHGSSNPRAEMMKFVTEISDATKAVNPHFKIVQNNALDLLTVNPDDPSSATNTAYISKIDAVNAESTFYEGNSPASWSSWNVQYLEHAVAAGKTVFAMDYPTSTSAQADFINKAIADHFVPYVTDENLTQVAAIDSTIMSKLPAGVLDSFLHGSIVSGNGGTGGSVTPPATPTPPPVVHAPASVTENTINGTNNSETINGGANRDLVYAKGGNDNVIGAQGNDGIDGGAGNDTLKGNSGFDWINGGAGNDHLYGGSEFDTFAFYKGAGNDVIHDFQNPGKTAGDSIDISSQIYSSTAQILSHTSYSGGNAVIHLEGSNSITVLGVAKNSLTAADFHIV